MSSESLTAHPTYGASAGLLRAVLPRPQAGTLHLVLPTGEPLLLTGAAEGATADLTIASWSAFFRMLSGGDVGFAEAFIDGDWSSSDLTGLLTWALQNEQALGGSTAGTALARLARRLGHWRNANTRRGSRRNIAAHYDLGNAFYAQWLDRGMSYSSALYEAEDQTLEQAQDAKLARIADLLDLRGGEEVLEIGFGWGGLIEHLATRFGARCTGLTLSQQQLVYARDRLARLPVDADLRLQDYRDVGGTYDRIVSIEMLEAVGERYWPAYFRTLRDRLRPGGRCVLQVITIASDRFARYRRQPDFIQRHIFPGGMLPTKEIVREQARRAGLRPTGEVDFGGSYARTLREWRRRFQHAWPSIQALGFDGRFHRAWLYYLAYCEAGFAAGTIDVSLFQLEG